MIEGHLEQNSNVVLVDDLITDGYSKINFVDGIRKAGSKVKDVLVVLDRQQGGTEALSKVDVKLQSLITLRELMEFLKEKNVITEDKLTEVLLYLKNTCFVILLGEI